MRISWFILLLTTALTGKAQQSPEQVVTTFFEHFNNHDTISLKTLCVENLQLHTVYIKGEDTLLAQGNPQEMFAFVASWKAQYKEEIGKISCIADNLVAVASVPYRFFLRNAQVHCGINQFQLIYTNGSWKILSIVDSRRMCQFDNVDADKAMIYQLLDEWHLAAQKADGAKYFASMHDRFVFLGTDPAERWTKPEFIAFCKPFFDKETGWAFTTKERYIDFSDDMQMAWVDEVLDTWMGPCRGTSTFIKEDGNWFIIQFGLAVLVPNNKMDTYLKAIWNKKRK